MYVHRAIEQKVLSLSESFPVVTINGPRQSGKTTMCKQVFQDWNYVTLENPTVREFALNDPMGFIATYPNRTIIDEVQRAPLLLSYLQGHIDAVNTPGMYILSGSQNLMLLSSVSQSLAGRTGLLSLLPFSYKELIAYAQNPQSVNEWLFKGAFPRLYRSKILPDDFYPAYIQTYLERDIRMEEGIVDIAAFQTFMKMCAARIGTILNVSQLSQAVGIDMRTCKRWLSALEASSVLFRVQPYFNNFNKRLVRSPKLYFCDTGLACALLGIRSADELSISLFKGQLFENMVFLERMKDTMALGRVPQVWFWTETATNEVDFIFHNTDGTFAVEAKSSATFNTNWFKSMKTFTNLASIAEHKRAIVYAGEETFETSQGRIISWKKW